MKKLFSIAINLGLAHVWLLLFRVLAASFMITHGLPKLLKTINGNFEFADPMGIGEAPSLVLAVFAELICSVFIIVGFATRLASIPLIITMAVAAFSIHGSDPFKMKEMSLLYLLVFTCILVFGPGKYSVDAMINKGKRKR